MADVLAFWRSRLKDTSLAILWTVCFHRLYNKIFSIKNLKFINKSMLLKMRKKTKKIKYIPGRSGTKEDNIVISCFQFLFSTNVLVQ